MMTVRKAQAPNPIKIITVPNKPLSERPILITMFHRTSDSSETRNGIYLNPLVTDRLSNPYHLDGSTFIQGHWGLFDIFISFFDENHVGIHNSPRCDAVFCDVTSEAILFAYVP